MKIGIFGSGSVAQTLATTLVAGGHTVMLGSREPGKLADWVMTAGSGVSAGSYAEVATYGEVLINATAGSGSLAALTAAGAEKLANKILIDVANPLDFSQGMPPTLFVSNTDSLGEQIQRTFPAVKVVKTLNTLAAALMVNPQQLANGNHSLFVSGNDAAAKAQVQTWLREWFGWSDVIDLGGIETARGTEMLLPIWLRLWGALGTPSFNVKIVRA
jgi:predicted dinucleotide-binding enzyme